MLSLFPVSDDVCLPGPGICISVFFSNKCLGVRYVFCARFADRH